MLCPFRPAADISLSRYPRKGVVLAVGIRIKLPGVTQEQFDAAHDHINPDRSPWPGMLFHSSGPIDGGWGVIDFWESRADFDAHLESNIQPGIAASGVQMQGVGCTNSAVHAHPVDLQADRVSAPHGLDRVPDGIQVQVAGE